MFMLDNFEVEDCIFDLHVCVCVCVYTMSQKIQLDMKETWHAARYCSLLEVSYL